jgi:hypothetical protein
MIILSPRTKEAIKTALAMSIAYGIALAMDWDNPKWAGVAVAVISLATIGQSLNKGALRMLGTLMAVAAALTMIALFPQDRWLFVLILSAWVGFCTYMMGGGKHVGWADEGGPTILCSSGRSRWASQARPNLRSCPATGNAAPPRPRVKPFPSAPGLRSPDQTTSRTRSWVSPSLSTQPLMIWIRSRLPL